MEIVSFELAKKLQEKGFREKTLSMYLESVKLLHMPLIYSLKDWNKEDNCYSAPTIPQVLNWLRKTHNLFIVVFLNDDSDNLITFEIYKGVECVTDYHIKYYSLDEWNKAEIDAIEYVLDNLI